MSFFILLLFFCSYKKPNQNKNESPARIVTSESMLILTFFLSFNKSELVAEGRMHGFFYLFETKIKNQVFKPSELVRVISKFKPFPLIV